MGCASSAPSLSRNGELKSATDSIIEEGTGLASKAKKSANDLLDVADDARDNALAKLQGPFEGLASLYHIANLPLGDTGAGETEENLAGTEISLDETGNEINEPSTEEDVPEIVLENLDEVEAGDAAKEQVSSAAEMAGEKMDGAKDAVQSTVESVKAKIDNLMPSSEEHSGDMEEGEANEEESEIETPAAAGEGDEAEEQTEDAEQVPEGEAGEEVTEDASASEAAPAEEVGEEEAEVGKEEGEEEKEEGSEDEKEEEGEKKEEAEEEKTETGDGEEKKEEEESKTD